MRLLVFLHGTVLMHPSALGRSREERVAQVRAGVDPSVHDYGAYVPVGDAVAKLRRWQRQGARIDYLSSHRDPDGVAADEQVLRRHGFPSGRVLARRPGQSYGDLAARERPDVLIEDDCQSIGPDQITYPRSAPTFAAASSRSSSPSSAASTISRTACRTSWPSRSLLTMPDSVGTVVSATAPRRSVHHRPPARVGTAGGSRGQARGTRRAGRQADPPPGGQRRRPGRDGAAAGVDGRGDSGGAGAAAAAVVGNSDTGGWVRVLGAILAGLVVGEVIWAGVYLVVGERQPYIWTLPALSAAVTVWLMLVTTRPDPRGPAARPAG